MAADSLYLSSKNKYAAGGIFAIALHHAQVHQTRPLAWSTNEGGEQSGEPSCNTINKSTLEDTDQWINEKSGLLRPLFSFLEIDSSAWLQLEETAGSSTAKEHIETFLRLLSEENGDTSSQMSEQEVALSSAVDAMVVSMQNSASSESKKEKQREFENECREKYSVPEVQPETVVDKDTNSRIEVESNISAAAKNESYVSSCVFDGKVVEEASSISYQRKVTVLYGLLLACLADRPEDDKKNIRHRKCYDARHRVALRLLATWLDIEDIKMEALETIVACSAMAIKKEEQSKEEETQSPKNDWEKWKRGGIIGAAAVTGGTLMAITGGLAAPALAAGFSALAPTLGTIMPVIGASGFAAAASAAGTVAGSVAVAASFGAAGAGLTGTKMARRIGGVEEFEFIAFGENHNQGRLAVEILVSGFVFDEEDFVKPWEGRNDNLERYALQWESQNLIAVSTAIQDWLTSKIAMELMKQGAMHTVLGALFTALAWPAALLSATDFIDNKWAIAVDRSDKAGKLLAEVLLKGLQGNRPVTLVAYSLGARVVFKCLQTLAETEQSAQLVERVVLLGAPISIKDESWEAARKMVAGRFVNAYSTNDWMLGVAFRTSLLSQGLAGIQPINIPGIENVDITDIIQGHSSYLWTTEQIMERLRWDTYGK